MSKSIKFRFVDLDTHADSITMGVADEGREAAQLLGDVPNDFASLTKVLRRLGPSASSSGWGLEDRAARRHPRRARACTSTSAPVPDQRSSAISEGRGVHGELGWSARLELPSVV